MLSLFLTPDYIPFSVAFAVMIGIGLIQVLGLADFALHADVDVHADMDGHMAPGVLDWLGVGQGLPLLIWLTSLLGCFTISGFAAQQIATSITGEPLHWGLASLAALVTGAVANRFASAGLARILPSDETTVIDVEDLIMRRGTVLEGTASRGHPARAKVVDQHGQAHYVMIEPHNDGDIIAQGETALLVRKDQHLFFVVPEAGPPLRPI